MLMWQLYNVVVVLLAFAVGMCRGVCEPEFVANLASSLQLTYPLHQGSIDKIWVRVAGDKPLVDLLTEECRNIDNLRLDYRIAGQKEWSSFTGRRGVIALHKKSAKIQNIDPCSKYEFKVVAIKSHGGGEVESETVSFGPYYTQLSSPSIQQLGPDSMPDISSSITYSNVNSSGFTVSWGEICAQSLNVYLLTGPDYLYGNIIYTLNDIIRTNTSRRLWVAAQPCMKYKIAIESFMTTHPLSMENSVDHLAKTTVSTFPGLDDLVQATLEERENFKIFSWTFVDHGNCLEDEKYEIYLTSQTSEEKNILKTGTSISKQGEIDLTDHSYRSAVCSDVDLRMRVNYTTKSGIHGTGIVFNGTLRTNEKGEFGEEGTNLLTLGHETITVTFGSCQKEATLLLVENLTKNVIKYHKVIGDAPQVSLETFTEHTKPCEKYKIGLATSNESIQNKDIFQGKEFPAKHPVGNIKMELFNATSNNLTFEIIDVEENDNCDTDHYKVKCEEQNNTTDNSDVEDNDSVANPWKKTVTVISNESNLLTVKDLNPHKDFICQAQIIYKSSEGDISTNSSLLLARTGEAPMDEKEREEVASANVDKTHAQKMTLIGGVVAVILLLVIVVIVSGIVFKCRSSRRDSLHVSEQADYKPV